MLKRATEKQRNWSAGILADDVRPVSIKPSAFEELVAELGLDGQESTWQDNPRIEAFCRANVQAKYCPEFLLAAYGLTVEA